MRKRKEGVALITVVIIFMFVSVVSMAMLSMITANYKARVSESKRIENLYGSDSGIDVAYNIMVKTFDVAIENGQKHVELLKDSTKSTTEKETIIEKKYVEQYKNIDDDINNLKQRIKELENINKTEEDKDIKETNRRKINEYREYIEEDKITLDLLINEVFKDGFKYVFEYTNNEEGKSKFNTAIAKKQYIENVSEVNNLELKNLNYMASSDKDKASTLSLQDFETILSNEENVNNINRNDKDYKFTASVTKTKDTSYKIKIQSEFATKNAAVGHNKRAIEANYMLNVPNYDEVYLKTTTNDKEYIGESKYKFIVGGNMIIEQSAVVNINDDIYVFGDNINNSNESINYTNRAEKYRYGIQIGNQSNVTFNKNVVTRKTFNIQDGTNVTVNGNVYAGNIYIGKIESGKEKSIHGAQLNVRDSVILDNDLTVKATGSNITMKNFYGINDKNIYYDDGKVKNINTDGPKEKSSSSILINSDGNSTSQIIISESAYLMGTGYINTQEGYQTGESGAVKGNYSAYSVPIIKNNDENPEKFNSEKIDDDAYLQLLDEKNVFKKADHFKAYWEEQKNSYGKEANSGGIIWPSDKNNIFSIGAIVYKNDQVYEIIRSNYNRELEEKGGVIYNQRKRFAENVYKLGEKVEDKDKDYDYTNENEIGIKDIMDLSKIGNDYDLSECMDHRDKYAIFNSDENKTIEIKKSTTNEDSISVDDKNKKIEIYVAKKDKIDKSGKEYRLDAFIASNGNVSVEDDMNLNGNLIIAGNLTIDNTNVEINYDETLIKEIQSDNPELFQAIFGGTIVNLEEEDGERIEEYDINKFLNKKLWKIVH